MFALLNKLKPRVQVSKQLKGGLVSVRWLMVNFDYVKGEGGFKFVQFGNQNVRWIMFLPKNVKCPMFLNGRGWSVKLNRKLLKLGTTTKPLNFRNMWRIEDERAGDKKDWGRARLQQQNKPLRLGVERRLRDVRDIKAAGATKRDVPVHGGAVPEVRCACSPGKCST